MNLYRIVYQLTQPVGNTNSVFVSASSQPNAISAAQAADANFATVVTVETIAESIIVGS